MDEFWGVESTSGTRTVDVYMTKIRDKFSNCNEFEIVTVHGLGYKAVINGLHSGLLYYNQVFKPLQLGQHTKGYIARIREDEKIDLLLERPGYEKVDELSQQLLDALQKAGGFLPLTDKSVPADIEQRLGMSKKTFKKAIGALYKQRLVELLPDGIKQL